MRRRLFLLCRQTCIASLPPCCTASKCIQLSISGADPQQLTLLRDRINTLLLRAAGAAPAGGPAAENAAASGGAGKGKGGVGARPARRPLAPRSLNTLAATAGPSVSLGGWGSGSVVSLRSGPGGGVAPAASGFSLGTTSRQQLASSADSARSVPADEELGDLSDEQQRALQLVQSGRSIFFTGRRSWAAGEGFVWEFVGGFGWAAAVQQCLRFASSHLPRTHLRPPHLARRLRRHRQVLAAAPHPALPATQHHLCDGHNRWGHARMHACMHARMQYNRTGARAPWSSSPLHSPSDCLRQWALCVRARAWVHVACGRASSTCTSAGTHTRDLSGMWACLPWCDQHHSPTTPLLFLCTGLAACHLGGTTINSYAGIGRGEGSLGGLVPRAALAGRASRHARLRACEIQLCSAAFSRPAQIPSWSTLLVLHACRIPGAHGGARRVAAAVAGHHPPDR